MRRLMTVAMMAVVAVSLTACGRKGRPIPPEGTVNRTYPDIQFPSGPGGTGAQPEGTENTTR